MRVGYLTYGLDRAPSGIGRYAVELLHALAALPQRPEIVLLTTEREDRQGLWKQFEHYALPGCRLLPTLMTAGNLLLSGAAWRYRLDLIHDPNGIAPFLGPRGGARRIVTIHDAFTYVRPEAQNRLDNWRYRWLLPEAARRADAVITVSEQSKRDLVEHLRLEADQVAVTPEGVSARFKSVPDGERRRAVLAHYGIQQPYLLYVGGINARKNIARLLEAYGQLRECHPELALVVGGKRQWQAEDIDATSKRLNLAETVRFTGYVSEDDLPALYSAAELFVFPSLYEGFGLPPLEAMACGTPVVTSDAASLLEVTGEAAITVNPYDVDGLTAAMERLITDRALKAELRSRGLRRAALFSWQHTALETLRIYRQVWERPAPGRLALSQGRKKEHEL